MYYAYYSKSDNTIIITNKLKTGYVFLCSKERSISRVHWSMLTQFKLTNGSYMMSNELLMLVSRIFKKDYEDLWNYIYLRDQIDLKDPRTLVVRPKRTDEEWLSDQGILGDQGI